MALAAVVVAAVLGWRALSGERRDATRYRTEAVDQGDLVERVTAVGTLQALVQVDISSQVSGRVSKLYTDFNARVRRGEPLAEIDPTTFQAAAGQARAQLAAARAKLAADRATAGAAELSLRRAEELRRGNFNSQADLDGARALLDAARASLDADEAQIAQAAEALRLAQANLSYTVIRAPIDAVVISRAVNVGQTVAASLQAPILFVLAEDLARMQVLANVDEADVGRLREGMRAAFTVDAFPGETFGGTIRQIRFSPVTVQNVVTYVAAVEVQNPELKLRPGMTATVEVVTRERRGEVRIPNAALRYHPPAVAPAKAPGAKGPPPSGANHGGEPPAGGGRVGRLYVLRVGRPVLELVRLGASDGRRTELVAGQVQLGDRVIVEATPEGGAGRRFKIF